MRRMVEVTLLRSGIPYDTLAILDEDAVWMYFCIIGVQRRNELQDAQLSGGF